MKKILVVEDDKNVSKALGIRLASHGYSVITALDGMEGIIEAAQQCPDLILLDISMPAGDGFSVAEAVEAIHETRGTPIVFLTANSDPELRKKALALDSVVGFFGKPYDPDELLATIHDAIGEPFEQEAEILDESLLQ